MIGIIISSVLFPGLFAGLLVFLEDPGRDLGNLLELAGYLLELFLKH